MPKTIALGGPGRVGKIFIHQGYNTVIYDDRIENADVIIYNNNEMDHCLT